MQNVDLQLIFGGFGGYLSNFGVCQPYCIVRAGTFPFSYIVTAKKIGQVSMTYDEFIPKEVCFLSFRKCEHFQTCILKCSHSNKKVVVSILKIEIHFAHTFIGWMIFNALRPYGVMS